MIRPLRDRDPTPPDPGPAIDAAIAHILDEVDYDPLAGHVVARVEVEVEPADILAALAPLRLGSVGVMASWDAGSYRVIIEWDRVHHDDCPTRIDHALRCICLR